MIERKQISDKREPQKDMIKQAGLLLKDSGNDFTKRAAGVSQICVLLAKETDKAKQGIFIDKIAKTHGITKTVLRDGVKNIEKEIKRKAKESEDKETLTKTDRYELYLSEKFDIRFNEVSLEFEISDKTNPEADKLDEYAILREMRKAGHEITERTLIEILKSPYVFKYNPFADYFGSLKDYNPHTEPNYIHNLCTYIFATDPLRFETHFTKHLVRCVAGAFQVDFNKQVFVIVGDGTINQNSGKTSLIRWLVPPDLKKYYTEDLAHDKDGLISLTDNFIINFDELDSLSHYDLSKLKSIFSKETIKVRPPYGRRAISISRRASFFASTNEMSFLTDLTGNVRWLGFKLKDIERPINWDYSKDMNINDIWRQVFYLFNNGFEYKLTRAEIAENEIHNFEFMSLPPEYDLISKIYIPGTKGDADLFYTATDFVTALNEKTGSAIKFNPIRLGKVLRNLGFKQVSERPKGSFNPVKGYFVKFNLNYNPNNTPDTVDTMQNIVPVQKARQTEMKLRNQDTPF